MEEKKKKLEALKREKRAVIMAHYYVPGEVQEIANYVGDSYYLSEMATRVDCDIIVLCGVRFMGESAKILNPKKKVLLPAANADCPMAHMATVERIEEVRREHPDAAVVCYVNSTAELKSHSDVCVTSSNAVKIVRALPNKEIFFIPDEHLGAFVAEQVPEKTILQNDGYCHVHANIRPEEIMAAKKARPEAKVLVHPECQSSVVQLADYVGSTAGIIQYATKSEASEFIVATELGVLTELKKRNPEKKFYAAGNTQICPNMKKITLDGVIDVLLHETNEVIMEESMREAAYAPLCRMLELAKD
ncbi:MAG: quinolinate synthase NadA [Fusicatenibacter sp.]|nr:quinolinate synthase NadA [Lachnospiraceae bacterium]MDY2938678.1 quinolinate synthase NadA [Fusicatenibacter sp.]